MTATEIYIIGGVLVILAAWLPLFIRGLPLSLAMLALAIGLGLPFLASARHPLIAHSAAVEHVAEFALIVSVLGAGLEIERRFSLSGWACTWRMLVVMLMQIAAVAALAMWLLDVDPGFAIIFGAILSPTDPVLAGSSQPAGQSSQDAGEARFALTSEAGLNDGLAFPFVALGLTLLRVGTATEGQLLHWFVVDFVWDIGGAVLLGVVSGWLLIRVNERLPPNLRLAASESGLVAVGLGILAFGVANALHCNGFIAVFCEAVALRNFARPTKYGRRLRHTAKQFERVAMVVILAYLGIAVSHGLLADISAPEMIFASIVLVAVRPPLTYLAFIASPVPQRVKLALAYFGIRGIASIYYATYLIAERDLEPNDEILGVVALVVLLSVILYGLTTGVVTTYLFRQPPQ